jgi:tetratricopeptide (TPR) repeat protein
MSKEEAERLAALGYASFSGEMDADDLPDPKDRLPIMNRLREVDELKKQGRFAEALMIATEIADQAPGVDNPILTIAELQVRLGRPKRAITVLEECAGSYYSSEVMVALARLYYEQKRYEQMERALQAVEIKDPERGAVPLTRGDRYYDEERYEEAVREYEKAIQIDGERVGRAVGVKLRRARKLAENRTP